MSATVKTPEQIEIMARAGAILHDVLAQLAAATQPGVTGADLDRLARELIAARGAQPAFLGYDGFPAAVCVSTAPAVVHGIPNDTPFQAGEVICVDCGVLLDGWYSDSAITVALDPVKDRTQRLRACAQDALQAGIAACQPGTPTSQVSDIIGQVIRRHGFAPLAHMYGHGIGLDMHEDPILPNEPAGVAVETLQAGMTVCVEPIIVSDPEVVKLPDEGYGSRDGLAGWHAEHTIVIDAAGPRILT